MFKYCIDKLDFLEILCGALRTLEQCYPLVNMKVLSIWSDVSESKLWLRFSNLETIFLPVIPHNIIFYTLNTYIEVFKDSRNTHLVVLRMTSLRDPFTLFWDHKKDSQRLNPQTATWRIRACAHVCTHTHTSLAYEMLIYVTCYNYPNTEGLKELVSVEWGLVWDDLCGVKRKE